MKPEPHATSRSAPAGSLSRTKFESAQILIVDDEPKNLDVLTRILHRAGYTNTFATTDPIEGLTLYTELDPDLLLLDLNMPGLDGIAVMQRLRQVTPRHGYLSVLVLTGDTSRRARRQALAMGAKDFLTKPFEIDEVLLRINNLLEARQLHREITGHNLMLEERVRERTAELEAAQLETLERLAIAAEFRDDDTGRHTQRVGKLAALLSRAVGLTEPEIALIERAAPLHDVGKIGIADSILLKPGPLTQAERRVMQTHTTMGAKILSGGRSSIMRLAEEIALSHHEWWDGSGYPEGRAGERTPLSARIVAIADFFDALCSARVYRPAWPVKEVLAEIRRQRGVQFDPSLVELCWRPSVHPELIAFEREEPGRDLQRLLGE
jgi:response regulator RpfG family c-di-GMP phosphodiesterase